MQKITARDEEGLLSFNGEMIAEMTWSYEAAKARGHQRWTDLVLYRVAEEGVPYRYALQVVARSVVYHKTDGPCHRGVRMTVGVLARDVDAARFLALDPCAEPGCQPLDLDDLADEDRVKVEEDFPALHRCETAAQVVDILKDRMRGPAWRLMQAACRVDEDFIEPMAALRGL